MGIKDYVKFVKKVYSSSCKRKWLSRYTHLYIDLNHALHHVCYKSRSSKEILSKIKSYLNEVISRYRPTKKIYIGADGPAPIAKMVLQRRRRYDKVKTLKSDEELNLTKNLSLNFTPGTEFMLNLADELSHFSSYLSIVYGVEVELDIESDDEGEVKIRRKVAIDQKKDPSISAIVYSGDADMILLLISLKRLQNVYQILDKNTVLSFGRLYNTHFQRFCGVNPGTSKIEDDRIIRLKRKVISVKNDFIFINLLFGNDYLPKVLYIKFEHIWKAYSELSPYYPDGLVKYDKLDRSITINREFIFRLINRTTDQNRVDYDKKFSVASLTQSDLEMYSEYMKGIAWCFDMYTTGVCSDYRYIYDHSAPHYDGLLLQIMHNNIYSVPQTKSIDSDLYGILLIPEKAKVLLSEKQKKLSDRLIKSHPIIYEEERCQKCSIFSKSLSTYNKQMNLLRSDSTTDSDLVDNDILDNDDISEELTSDDDEVADPKRKVVIREELLAKIRDSNLKYSKHRASHDALTLKTIEDIERTFTDLAE